MTMETQAIHLHTADGVRLAADVVAVPDARAAAVLCHPHPLYGGDRHHPLITGLAAHLASAGIASVRFDFRGGGSSEGTHGGGVDERLDVEAALDAAPGLTSGPLWLIGYSFGAAVALATAAPQIAGWVAIAPPLAMMPPGLSSATDPRPKALVVPRHDQFSPPDAVAVATVDWTATTLTVVESADHFLNGHLARVIDLAAAPLLGTASLTTRLQPGAPSHPA